MAHHAGAHKTQRKTLAAGQPAHTSSPRASEEHDEKTKLTAVGLLFSPNGHSHEDEEFGSPRPSHLVGDQPMTLDVPHNTLKPGDAGKGKPDVGTKKTKISKDDKDKNHKGVLSKEEIEATLSRKRYAEDDIDMEQLKAKVIS